MSATVYIESSIISYLTARASRDVVTASRQAITSEWWLGSKSQFEVFISALVEEEISAGGAMAAAQRLQSVAGISSVAITEEAQALADILLASKAVPANSARDALHIAIAATQGMEYFADVEFQAHQQCGNSRTYHPCCGRKWLGMPDALLTRRTWR